MNGLQPERYYRLLFKHINNDGIEIFDNNLELVHNSIAKKGDIIALFHGGHGLKMSTDCEFIEVKQGPYIEEIDKKRF